MHYAGTAWWLLEGSLLITERFCLWLFSWGSFSISGVQCSDGCVQKRRPYSPNRAGQTDCWEVGPQPSQSSSHVRGLSSATVSEGWLLRLDVDLCCETDLCIFLKTCNILIKGNYRVSIEIFFCICPQVSFLSQSGHPWNRLGSVPQRDGECHHQPAEPTKVSTVCLGVMSHYHGNLGSWNSYNYCVWNFPEVDKW